MWVLYHCLRRRRRRQRRRRQRLSCPDSLLAPYVDGRFADESVHVIVRGKRFLLRNVPVVIITPRKKAVRAIGAIDTTTGKDVYFVNPALVVLPLRAQTESPYTYYIEGNTVDFDRATSKRIHAWYCSPQMPLREVLLCDQNGRRIVLSPVVVAAAESPRGLIAARYIDEGTNKLKQCAINRRLLL
jgi:hypothetical protein